ncbi:MAG: (2Fe-2S)-binding protein [Mariniblastus sp.]|nr:(2Fe-2S)-binding protein [Mariniblastus sp.]
MDPDDLVCLCFHVSRRKIQNHIRIEKPRRAAQLSECFGAGTGCGWCRPYLRRMFQEQTDETGLQENSQGSPDLSPADYARQRARYIREGRGKAPTDSGPDNRDFGK